MRLIRDLLKVSMVLAPFVLLAACSDNEKAVEVKQADAVQAKKDQFVFYKDLSIRPGINFEVVSWGKGVDTVGGYLILMSDSLRNNYRSLSNERKGVITDAWNLDMDNDGNPEIYIELLSKTNVLDLNVYEYSGGSFDKITFPPLSSSLKKNYAGNDKFFVKDGELFRTFPIVNSQDSTAKAGSLKTIRYNFRGNSFSTSVVEE